MGLEEALRGSMQSGIPMRGTDDGHPHGEDDRIGKEGPADRRNLPMGQLQAAVAEKETASPADEEEEQNTAQEGEHQDDDPGQQGSGHLDLVPNPAKRRSRPGDAHRPDGDPNGEQSAGTAGAPGEITAPGADEDTEEESAATATAAGARGKHTAPGTEEENGEDSAASTGKAVVPSSNVADEDTALGTERRIGDEPTATTGPTSNVPDEATAPGTGRRIGDGSTATTGVAGLL